MKVIDHALCSDAGEPVRYQPSPNRGGKLLAPSVLVIHYTAGRSAESAANWLCNPKAKASAHLIVERKTGSITQLVPFDRIAWHAGPSEWEGRERLNDWSIGIELDNPGLLQRRPGGWFTSFGEWVPDDYVVLDERGRGWHAYDNEQIVSAYVACEAIIDAFPTINTVVGHSDIAVPAGRKRDPGAAFPMDQFRSWLLGRGAG